MAIGCVMTKLFEYDQIRYISQTQGLFNHKRLFNKNKILKGAYLSLYFEF